MANIKVPLSEDLKLCINDARLICECLNMAKTTLKEVTTANIVVEQTIKQKKRIKIKIKRKKKKEKRTKKKKKIK